MKGPRRTLSLVTVLLLAAGTALSYTLTSPQRTWNCPTTYVVDQSGLPSIADADGGATAVVQAITSSNAWNGAGAGRIIKASKGDVSGLTSGDGIPMISFSDPLGICTGSCIAGSLNGYSLRSPGSGSYKLTDVDLVFNPSSSTSWTSQGEDPGGAGCSGEVYIEGFTVHEVGHGLGLGHTAVAGATMYPSVPSCSNSQATTEADDEAGLRALYGTSPCPACNSHTEYLASLEQEIQPCGSAYKTSVTGFHEGWLEGPATSNFDLYLDRYNGLAWVVVASSTGAASSEAISYNGLPGRYRYRVVAASGTGTYHFWERHP
ncbi:MAG TPA: matrixin family metalloprotease [Thermoanaerobaculia bacterium]|nr:matrixin family metalloprotease [Thermoanaerobaculia bacterium]